MRTISRSFLVALLCVGCARQPAPTATLQPSGKPRNVIVIIGDGMGAQQVGLASLKTPFIGSGFSQLFERSTVGVHLPVSESSIVNDSACSATQLGSGCSCDPLQVGVNSSGRPCQSFLDVARARGMRAGVVSDTRLTHATPASFSVHVEHRGSEAEIAEKMASSGLDLLMSGGLSYFLPKDGDPSLKVECARLKAPGLRKDSRNLLRELQGRGYAVACSQDELSKLQTTPVLGLFAPSEMKDAYEEGTSGEPSLVEMTRRSFDLLDNPAGFALMVEAGQIDWAGHDNDPDWLFAEMKRMDGLLEFVEHFVDANPDTLVIVTGDHETGGFGFSYRRARDSDSTNASSGGALLHFPDLTDFWPMAGGRRSNRSILKEFFSLPEAEQTAATLAKLKGSANKQRAFTEKDAANFLACIAKDSGKPKVDESRCPLGPEYPYDTSSPAVLLGRPDSAASSVVWSTGAHTHTPVLVFAQGPGAEQFQGVRSSAELGKRLVGIVGQQ